MDEIIDDEDDGMEEDIEEDELPIIDEQGPISGNPLAKKKKATEEELTEEQLARRHEVKMNRKVGKYSVMKTHLLMMKNCNGKKRSLRQKMVFSCIGVLWLTIETILHRIKRHPRKVKSKK